MQRDCLKFAALPMDLKCLFYRDFSIDNHTFATNDDAEKNASGNNFFSYPSSQIKHYINFIQFI